MREQMNLSGRFAKKKAEEQRQCTVLNLRVFLKVYQETLKPVFISRNLGLHIITLPVASLLINLVLCCYVISIFLSSSITLIVSN